MDRKGWPRSPAANPAKLRHPHDGVAWTAVEWRGSARLSADRICLYAGCATQLPDGEGVTLYVCSWAQSLPFRLPRRTDTYGSNVLQNSTPSSKRAIIESD